MSSGKTKDAASAAMKVPDVYQDAILRKAAGYGEWRVDDTAEATARAATATSQGGHLDPDAYDSRGTGSNWGYNAPDPTPTVSAPLDIPNVVDPGLAAAAAKASQERNSGLDRDRSRLGLMRIIPL